MARERMVTRTVITTMVDVLVINIETAETATKSFVLTQNMTKDEKQCLTIHRLCLKKSVAKCGKLLQSKT